MDLFKTPENIPTRVLKILNEYEEYENGDTLEYYQLAEMLTRCEAVGYTFEYGLDAIPFNLKPLKTK
jgi:hypothetical protein